MHSCFGLGSIIINFSVHAVIEFTAKVSFQLVLHGYYNQGKSGKNQRIRGREFYILKSGKTQRVRESRGI